LRAESLLTQHQQQKSQYGPDGSLKNSMQADPAAGRPYLIDANIDADQNPQGAGVWELPGLGRSRPGIGGRYEPGH
jgi:acetolactate synthase I/II/III large subunit